MALALASQERLRRQQQQAAQAVQQNVAAAEAKEQKEQSERRIAEAKQRQQQQQLAKAKAAQEAEKAKAAETSRALAANTGTHKVGSGETLYSIAKRYNMSVADLTAANHIKGEHIQAGQNRCQRRKSRRSQTFRAGILYRAQRRYSACHCGTL